MTKSQAISSGALVYSLDTHDTVKLVPRLAMVNSLDSSYMTGMREICLYHFSFP